MQNLGGEAIADAGDRADGSTVDVAVIDLRVDTDHQEHVVVDAGDVLGGVGKRFRPAKLLEADEVGMLRAQLEEKLRLRLKAIVGAIVDYRGKLRRGGENSCEVVSLRRGRGSAREKPRDDHQPASSNLLGVRRMSRGSRCILRAGPDDHRNAGLGKLPNTLPALLV